ncbi:MAG TPA: TIR domain-containing protein [Candidatus Nanoarchaeia archaeon]|nr:TIR domain-containing protein [Candidatus Nanoarchaeia archaeon]
MARRVFFSFHYERDVWRAGQVRNSWVTQDSAGFIDSASWEEVKKKGNDAIKKWIADELAGTSVTIVLIGKETSDREWVIHEIIESYNKGNGLIGIYVHNLKDSQGNADIKGKNPFENVYIEKDGRKRFFSEIYPTYDWVNDDGYNNIGKWVESAAPKE